MRYRAARTPLLPVAVCPAASEAATTMMRTKRTTVIRSGIRRGSNSIPEVKKGELDPISRRVAAILLICGHGKLNL